MIFVVVEDGTVEVLDRPEAALQYEPLDVESGVFLFYDEDGTWLKPRFTKPNRRRIFGLLLENGSFELERTDDLDPDVDPFDVVLSEAQVLEPNRYFATLDAVRQHVASLQASRTNATR
jgi:hypothetical protein